MESGVTKEFSPALAETQNVTNTESADSFQSFIYELFEKNGILNDLRAYLRGHIVNVLKSAQTGDPPPCQKHFTQRLELTYQALNILIAEYLLRLEFTYSFSVFISEIPLANMVFGFAKSLMERTEENKAEMRFRDTDVWSILNYLGVQCDSEHASNIFEMYKNDKQQPLLLCILKCMPMYKEYIPATAIASDESLSSAKTLISVENKDPPSLETCKHYVYCKSCQNRMYRLKELSKKKKKCFAKMFQQLKSVYETEVEMVKVEEENKVKRSMASHALQLQKKRDEMEETFKAREAELERTVQQKKRFLWGLARALRDQHEHMTRAMHDVRAETQRLSVKEDSLKSQLAEAEQILKKRGEEMRAQISNELTILEGHLESMKQERENITKERLELENMKTVQESNSKLIKVHNMESETVHSHYNLLKDELAILRKYLESSKLTPKCVIERGTITEHSASTSRLNETLNNSQLNDKCSKSEDFEDRLKTTQVVNDFRKKNVNFSQSNLDEIYHERARERSRSSASSEAGDTAAPDLDLDRGGERDLIQRLREENERLKAIAAQQSRQIEQLSASAATQLTRPRTAPPVPAPAQPVYNVNTSASVNTVSFGWRKGAGEELSMFSDAQPRIVLPGDTLPFIGVLRDTHPTARRPPLGQSRAGRTRACWPLAGVTKRNVSPLKERRPAGTSGLCLRVSGAGRMPIASCSVQPQDEGYHRSIRFSSKESSYRGSPPAVRDKSPNAVLREAKMRLRKLEIEAEAVEKSYLDFRRKQSQQRLERSRMQHETAATERNRNIDVKRSRSEEHLDENTKNEIVAQFTDLKNSVRNDFDNYIREYKNRFDIGETHFRIKPSVVEKVKPIPKAYCGISEYSHKDERGKYLDTPLAEFRKMYASQPRPHSASSDRSPVRDHSGHSGHSGDQIKQLSARTEALKKAKNNKQAELELLKQNITKMYNLSPDDDSALDLRSDKDTSQAMMKGSEENLLRVEVESISEIDNIKSQTQELLLVVQSSVNPREMTLTGREAPGEVQSAVMTIIVSPKCSESQSPVPTPEHSPARGPGRSSSRSPARGAAGGTCAAGGEGGSPEQAAQLTRNDVLDAIFHADPTDHISSVQMQLELSKDILDDSASGEYDKGEYPDDFSADVDNYNSRSDYDQNSPISLPKTSEDDNDNFWDT
ncbi:uncharacterized protein LOC124635491 isoform X2 [Helicoverpa zea]|uniref:uncharacterized protein LOC124635491 isoform X2 n=1 Tax=Helicoverpa zea TaxID=7113 RepID=UPI001F583EB5|nr:uncharacterized protein LOC124635491 isoform X2 [Helicoverpa zea]